MTWLLHAVTAAPAEEPVSLAQARAQLQIEADDSDFDTELAIYIPAARQYVEAYTGLKLVTQTVDLRCSCFADLGRLPLAPVASITSVKYLDTEGAEQTLDPSVWEACLVPALEPRIRLKVGQTWPTRRPVDDAVRVVAVAGYGAAAAVPAPIVLAMQLLIGDWFANREDSTALNLRPMPNGVAALLENFRI